MLYNTDLLLWQNSRKSKKFSRLTVRNRNIYANEEWCARFNIHEDACLILTNAGYQEIKRIRSGRFEETIYIDPSE